MLIKHMYPNSYLLTYFYPRWVIPYIYYPFLYIFYPFLTYFIHSLHILLSSDYSLHIVACCTVSFSARMDKAKGKALFFQKHTMAPTCMLVHQKAAFHQTNLTPEHFKTFEHF